MVERIGIGVYETLTFPVPLPSKYRAVADPETAVDEFLAIMV